MEVPVCRTLRIRRLASEEEGIAHLHVATSLASVTPCHLPRTSSAHVLQDALANDLSEIHGHGIADQPSQYLEVDGFPFRNEAVAPWEPLEDGSFSERQSPILFWVAKSATTKAIELSRQCWCWLVPFHSAIDTWVALTGVPLVAIRHELLWPVPP